MKSANNIRKSLKELHVPTTARLDETINGEISRLLAEKRDRKSPITCVEIWTILVKREVVKFAIVTFIIIGFGLFLFWGNGQSTMYAQVLEAFEQARTMHLISKQYHDGQLFKEHEIRYDRKMGTIEKERYKNHTDVRIDDGKYELRYAEGEKLVSKLKSYQDKEEFVRALCVEWFKYNPKRIPSGDLTIGEVPCTMYIIAPNEENKVTIWIDGKNRVRKIEQCTESQNQKTKNSAIVDYDIVIDRSLFRPEFDSDVSFINPREWLERKYPLEAAVLTRKSLGFVFAVHEIGVCESNIKFIVCSTRLSDKTRSELNTVHPWTYYGQSDLFDHYENMTYYNHPILLARLKHDGMLIDWYLLLPTGGKALQRFDCNVDVIIKTANQLEEKCTSEGIPTSEKFMLNIGTQQIEKNITSIEEISSNIYALGKKLDPIIHSFLLTEVVSVNREGAQILAWRRPVIGISEEDYLRNVEKRVQEWIEKNR